MIKTTGNFDKKLSRFEYICFISENLQYIFNNMRLELKEHNKAEINPGFISKTLFDNDFQYTINSLHFLIDGSAELRFNNQKKTLSKGDIFFIGNHVKCDWIYTKPSKEITFLFNLYLGNSKDLFSNVDEPLIIHNRFDTTKKMDNLFNEDTCSSVLKIKNIFMDCLLEFLYINEEEFITNINLSKKYNDIFEYINNNLSINIKINDLKNVTKYSESFFTKTFVKDNSITLKKYVHDKVMAEVEQLLLYSDLPISEISDKFDFCELSYFTRWFKKYKNCSPTEYRKKFKNRKSLL